MTKVLEHVPASVKVVRHVEKRMVCRGCDTVVSGEMPTLPIVRGKLAYSRPSWARIPREGGHDFQAKVGMDSTARWAPRLRG